MEKRNRDLEDNLTQTDDKSYYNNIPWSPNPDFKLYHKTLSMDGYSQVNK